jgi:phosphoglycerol transferase MdoB-like AlkP superfamily enzyme
MIKFNKKGWLMISRFSIVKNFLLIFVLAYLLILITKITFFYYLNSYYIEYTNFEIFTSIIWGYKFDFAISSFVAFVISLFSFNKKLFIYISSFLLLLIFYIQIGDIFYFNESSRHIAYEIIDVFNDSTSLLATAYNQHFNLFMMSIIVSILLTFLYLKFVIKHINIVKFNKYYIMQVFLILLISIFFIRGMTQRIPLTPWQSNQIGDNKLASLTLNASYNVLYSLVKKNKLSVIKIPQSTNKQIKDSFKRLYKINKFNNNTLNSNIKPNVIFLFLESWSAKYMQDYGYIYNTTPNYSKILKNSIHPKFMIASGHRTTEGIFSTLTSMQNPLGKSVAKTKLQTNENVSIIDILNQNDYTSAFFQGTSKETSGTGSLAQSLGFKYSYGKSDIKERLYENNSWGVQDTDLYNFVNLKLSSSIKEPFVIGINGATTHDDKIPSSMKKIHYLKNEKINNLLNTFHYSDFAMYEFIKEIENKYPNTIFVIFADHCGSYIDDSLENYMIPFAIYSKKLIKKKYYDMVISQRDIAPTVLDILNYKYKNIPKSFSGKSLLVNNNKFADYYHNGILGLVQNNNVIELNIFTKYLKCFNMNVFKKEPIECSSIHLKMKMDLLSFTNISQKLLFTDKSEDMDDYIKSK